MMYQIVCIVVSIFPIYILKINNIIEYANNLQCTPIIGVQKGGPSYSAAIYTMDIAYNIDIPL